MDYIKPAGLRLALEVMVLLTIAAMSAGRSRYSGDEAWITGTQVRCDVVGGGLRDARRARARAARPQGRGAEQGVPTRSHTVAGAGRVAAPLANSSRTTGTGTCTTRQGSDYLGDQDAIEYMCRRANEVVVELEHMGMPSTGWRTAGSTSARSAAYPGLRQRKMAMRACAAADRTGHAMLHTLYQQNLRANTQFFVEWMALDLIRDPQDGAVLA